MMGLLNPIEALFSILLMVSTEIDPSSVCGLFDEASCDRMEASMTAVAGRRTAAARLCRTAAVAAGCRVRHAGCAAGASAAQLE